MQPISYDSILINSMKTIQGFESDETFFGVGTDELEALMRLERYGVFIEKCNGPIYEAVKNKLMGGWAVALVSGALFMKRMGDDIALVRNNYCEENLSPRIGCILRLVDDDFIYNASYGARRVPEREAKSIVEKANGIIDRIRMELRSGAMHKKIKDRERGARKNHHSLVQYVRELFENVASRIVAVRVDLSYTEDFCPSGNGVGGIVDYAVAKSDRQRLLKSMRADSKFKALIGYVWKLEYGVKTGLHYHMIFFFDGASRREDVTIGWNICNHWEEVITRGRGRGFNCNANKGVYKDRCGIGVISHCDVQKRKNLEDHVLAYLTKIDYFCKVVTGSDARVLGRGEMPAPRPSKAIGRPRTKISVR